MVFGASHLVTSASSKAWPLTSSMDRVRSLPLAKIPDISGLQCSYLTYSLRIYRVLHFSSRLDLQCLAVATPGNVSRSSNDVLMPSQRLRRWPSVKTALVNRPVFFFWGWDVASMQRWTVIDPLYVWSSYQSERESARMYRRRSTDPEYRRCVKRESHNWDTSLLILSFFHLTLYPLKRWDIFI